MKTLSAKELKQQMYGDFIKYLEGIGLGDPFSMDIWMSKAFDNLYKQFEKESERAFFLQNLPLEAVESLAMKKKAQRAKGNGKGGLILPDKDIVKP